MKFLVIGNIFKSLSIQVDDFCTKDSEVNISKISQRDSGAAIVVSTIAAILGVTPFILSKMSNTNEFDSLFNKLEQLGVNSSLSIANDLDNNFLLTIYDQYLDRNGYSYISNGVTADDLINIDYLEFDAVFFCFLHADMVNRVFRENSSIKKLLVFYFQVELRTNILITKC